MKTISRILKKGIFYCEQRFRKKRFLPLKKEGDYSIILSPQALTPLYFVFLPNFWSLNLVRRKETEAVMLSNGWPFFTGNFVSEDLIVLNKLLSEIEEMYL